MLIREHKLGTRYKQHIIAGEVPASGAALNYKNDPVA